MNMKNYAVITGASSGIGQAFAREFARRGISTIMVARSEEKLNQLSAELESKFNADAISFPMDLADLSSRSSLVKFCATNNLEIDYLVNSAGYGSNGLFHKLDIQREMRMAELNCLALQELNYEFVKVFLKKKRGTIINIASTAAFQPVPFMASYAATKSFVLSFRLALHRELKGSGVNVMAVCPGPVGTNFFDNAGIKSSPTFPSMHTPSYVVKKVF